MTRMADELGLLVWSEIPSYWRVALDNPQTLATARHMLAEEILRDRNRASIAIWSVGNETPVSDARNAFLTTLAKDAHALDDSRLVSAALLVGRKEEGGTSVRSEEHTAEIQALMRSSSAGFCLHKKTT